MDKKATRLRRAKKTRAKLASQDKARLCVHRTPKHIYAQIISSGRNRTKEAEKKEWGGSGK